MELGSITPSDDELTIRLQEVGISDPSIDYPPSDKQAKRHIYEGALSVLNSVANDAKLMHNYREEDQTISGFQQNIRNRITQLDNMIRKMDVQDYTEEDSGNSGMFMLFK